MNEGITFGFFLSHTVVKSHLLQTRQNASARGNGLNAYLPIQYHIILFRIKFLISKVHVLVNDHMTQYMYTRDISKAHHLLKACASFAKSVRKENRNVHTTQLVVPLLALFR